jgi:hypothetical protein
METEKTFTRDQVVNKVKKLLDLSKGTNFDGEISAALNLARQLLAKYNLSMSDVEAQSYSKEEPRFMNSRTKTGYWQPKLAKVVADYCNCRVFYYGRVLRFIGMDAELEICSYTFHLVAEQIDKMMRSKRKEIRSKREEEFGYRQDRRSTSYYTRGYSTGIIDKITLRLKERIEKEKTGVENETGTALVLVEHPQIVVWWDKNIEQKQKRRKRLALEAGYSSGYKDGDSIRLNKGIRGTNYGRVTK